MTQKSKSNLVQNYRRQNFSPVRGKGVWLYDNSGNKYLDALSGIAVNTLGHSHQTMKKNLKEQIENLIHVSNLYGIPLQEQLGTKLCSLAGLSSAFFCNSGLEANEAALKYARKFAVIKSVRNPKIIVFNNAFHGRSFATMSASDKKKGTKNNFGNSMPGFIRAPINDIRAVKDLSKKYDNIVAVMLEPIQGEGGINLSEVKFLKDLRMLCSKKKWLLILDEVQCGIARTGKWFAFQWAGITPDVVTLAKGLGSGVPIGATLVKKPFSRLIVAGEHGSTFGGNPLAMQAALTTISVIETEGLLNNALQMGQKIVKRLEAGLNDYEEVTEIRHKGLMIGIEFAIDCSDLVNLALAEKLLINVTGGNVVRILPPLILKKSEAIAISTKVISVIRKLINHA